MPPKLTSESVWTKYCRADRYMGTLPEQLSIFPLPKKMWNNLLPAVDTCYLGDLDSRQLVQPQTSFSSNKLPLFKWCTVLVGSPTFHLHTSAWLASECLHSTPIVFQCKFEPQKHLTSTMLLNLQDFLLKLLSVAQPLPAAVTCYLGDWGAGKWGSCCIILQ